MAKYIKIFLDNKRRQNFNERLMRKYRLNYYLTNTPIYIQTSTFKNYCQISGASRSIYYKFALSRHYLRKYANMGLIPGVMPSSW